MEVAHLAKAAPALAQTGSSAPEAATLPWPCLHMDAAMALPAREVSVVDAAAVPEEEQCSAPPTKGDEESIADAVSALAASFSVILAPALAPEPAQAPRASLALAAPNELAPDSTHGARWIAPPADADTESTADGSEDIVPALATPIVPALGFPYASMQLAGCFAPVTETKKESITEKVSEDALAHALPNLHTLAFTSIPPAATSTPAEAPPASPRLTSSIVPKLVSSNAPVLLTQGCVPAKDGEDEIIAEKVAEGELTHAPPDSGSMPMPADASPTSQAPATPTLPALASSKASMQWALRFTPPEDDESKSIAEGGAEGAALLSATPVLVPSQSSYPVTVPAPALMSPRGHAHVPGSSAAPMMCPRRPATMATKAPIITSCSWETTLSPDLRRPLTPSSSIASSAGKYDKDSAVWEFCKGTAAEVDRLKAALQGLESDMAALRQENSKLRQGAGPLALPVTARGGGSHLDVPEAVFGDGCGGSGGSPVAHLAWEPHPEVPSPIAAVSPMDVKTPSAWPPQLLPEELKEAGDWAEALPPTPEGSHGWQRLRRDWRAAGVLESLLDEVRGHQLQALYEDDWMMGAQGYEARVGSGLPCHTVLWPPAPESKPGRAPATAAHQAAIASWRRAAARAVASMRPQSSPAESTASACSVVTLGTNNGSCSAAGSSASISAIGSTSGSRSGGSAGATGAPMPRSTAPRAPSGSVGAVFGTVQAYPARVGAVESYKGPPATRRQAAVPWGGVGVGACSVNCTMKQVA